LRAVARRVSERMKRYERLVGKITMATAEN
jgi:hypothetical protein